MRDLIFDLIPHAPKLGLFVAPHLPADRVGNAVRDFGAPMREVEVVALYDATLRGNGKDGALFAADRFVFQNNDLEPPQLVRYEDLIRVETKRKLLGGRKIGFDVNRGRATVNLTLDFSGKPEAAPYVARFLNEALLRGAAAEMDAPPDGETDQAAVRRALDDLRRQNQLSDDDYARLLAALGD